MSGVTAYNANDPYEMLIQSTIAIESQPKLRLTEEKAAHTRMKGVMSDFSKMLTELQTALTRISDPITPLFGARAASTSSTAFGVNASDRADLGTHSLEVHRLASSDARVSRQFDKAGTSLAGFNGAQSFQIEVFSPSADDPQRRIAVDVNVDISAADDAEALDQIRVAIHDAMRQAADDGIIKHTEIPAASIVNETSGTARLSIRSATSGFDGRLGFVDGGSGLLAALEVDNDAIAEGTSGGQTVAVGTSETDSELNSVITLDGLTLYRSSNRISDALTGVTLDLQHVSTAGAESFVIGNDNESITDGVTEFIAQYNKLITYIEQKTHVDGEANVRGDFAGDSAIRNLRMAMRNEMVRAIGGEPGQNPRNIEDLGITIERNGTLTLSDESKLMETVASNPTGVQSYFSGDEGLATRMQEQLERFLGANGLISERQKSLDARIQRIDSRVRTFETQMARREESLRLQFARMQETIAILQGQQNYFMSFFQGG